MAWTTWLRHADGGRTQIRAGDWPSVLQTILNFIHLGPTPDMELKDVPRAIATESIEMTQEEWDEYHPKLNLDLLEKRESVNDREDSYTLDLR